MMKLMTMVVGTMVVVAGCAGSTTEDSTASLTSAVSKNGSSSGTTDTSANAEGERSGKGDHHRGPPPEAFTACEGKAAGDACSVTTPDGETLAGTCASPPADAPDTRIACRPDRMPEGGPPPHGRGGGGDCDGDGPGGEKAEGKPEDSAAGPS